MNIIKLRREQIIELEIKAENLKKNGKYLECMEVMEEVLNIKKFSYGDSSEETLKTSEKLCELCNLNMLKMQQQKKELTQKKFETALDFLRKAETLCAHSLPFRSVTLNNLGCFYRRTGKVRSALTYLQQALDIELKLKVPTSTADTHLNICAVLSQLNKHEDALEHILMAISLLQDEFLNPELIQNVIGKNENENENEEEKRNREKEAFFQRNSKNLEDRAAVLTIAYHNMGVELEFLKRFAESSKTYEKGIRFASKYLGKNHHLVENLKETLNTSEKEIQAQRMKETKKKEDREAIVNYKNEIRKKPMTAFTESKNRKSARNSQYFNGGVTTSEDFAKDRKKHSSMSHRDRDRAQNSYTPNVPQGKVAYRALNVSPEHTKNFSKENEKGRDSSIIKENTNSYIDSPIKSNFEMNRNGEMTDNVDKPNESP